MAEKNIRNIAIIAHVDHGKTTLVDCMLKQSGVFRDNQQVQERVLDSNDLERERGITILSKNISITYKGVKINVVDTPGHADFGGEVERVLGMVDGALLIVDAAEGPMPQTRFVLSKALELGIKIIVVINKIDKPAADPDGTLDKVFDLFTELTDREDLIDFPYIYASSLNGFAIKHLDDERKDVTPLLDCILENIQEPDGDVNKPFQFRATTLDYNEYVGRIVIGRIANGKVSAGEQVVWINSAGDIIRGKITKLFGFKDLGRVEIDSAEAGDIPQRRLGQHRPRHQAAGGGCGGHVPPSSPAPPRSGGGAVLPMVVWGDSAGAGHGGAGAGAESQGLRHLSAVQRLLGPA